MQITSNSERHGLQALNDSDLLIYSVGISTAGAAEIWMAKDNPRRHITATTLDIKGAIRTRELVAMSGFSNQIDIKIEDISQPLSYPNEYFDYVYARLVLHYLPEQLLHQALSEIYRVLKPGGRMFIVVRSDKCDHPHFPDSTFDPVTKLTEYSVDGSTGGPTRIKRHFFSEEELSDDISKAGFIIQSTVSANEPLFKDFERTILYDKGNWLIEVLASRPDIVYA